MNERIQAILSKLTELVSSLAGKQDKLYSSGANQNVKTINNNSILGTGNIEIEGFSGDYNDLTNKPTIPTVPTNVSSFNNDSGYITGSYHDASKQNVPAVVTSGTTLALADNTEYRLTIADGDTCTYTLPSGNYECYMRLTIASGATFSITFVPPTGETIKYIGTAPEFAAGEEWEISVKDGVIASAKVGDGT